MRNKKWVRLLAYVTGSVNQELLLQNEYLAAENRILRMKLSSKLRIVTARPLLRRLAVALRFPAHGRRTPSENSRDEPQRFTVCMQTVNLDPLREAQLFITSFSHRNTFVRCCT